MLAIEKLDKSYLIRKYNNNLKIFSLLLLFYIKINIPDFV